MTVDRDDARAPLLFVVTSATDAASLRPVADALRDDHDLRLLVAARTPIDVSRLGGAPASTIDLDRPPLTPTTRFQGIAQRIEHAIAAHAPSLVMISGSSALLRETAVAATAANVPVACVGTPQRAGSRDLWESQMNLRHAVVLCSMVFVETAAEAEHLLDLGCDPQPLRVCDSSEGIRRYRAISTAPAASFGVAVAVHAREWLRASAGAAAQMRVALA